MKRDLETDLKMLTIIPKDPDETTDMVHDVVAPHALKRAIEAEKENNRLVSLNERMAQKLEIAEKALHRIEDFWEAGIVVKTYARDAIKALEE